MLQVTNVSEFRKNLKKYIDGVAGTHHKVIVNSNGKSVVMMSLDEFNGMDETDYLLSTEANKKMMYEAKEQIECGLAVPVNISELINALEND
jgi:antitoxin YefM